MAKNKKPKFLEKETPELLNLLKDTLSTEDEVDVKKALKITEELISRQPNDEAPFSVDEALQDAAARMTEALNKVKAAYDNEVAMMEDSDEDLEDEEEEEEEEKTSRKGKKDKKSKKGGKKAQEEEDEEEEEEEEKTSRKGKKDKKSKKGGKKAQEEEDEEEEEEEDSEDDDDGEDYSDWSTKDLKAECRKRGIKVSKGMGKADLVKALEADDRE